jgi:hypothetical protein
VAWLAKSRSSTGPPPTHGVKTRKRLMTPVMKRVKYGFHD